MKNVMIVAIVGVAAFGFWHFRHRAAPSAQEVEPALRAYLKSAEANHCSGSMTLDALDGIRMGDFSNQFGGWPVYAEHAETCHEGNNSTTFNGRHDAERNVAVAFVRRSATGKVELFVPALFQAGERDAQQAFQKALDSIPMPGSGK